MSSSGNNFTTALSTRVYAPDNAGFTHTTENQFVYFEGSNAGVRETFGMPSAELRKLVNKYYDTYKKTESKECEDILKDLAFLNEQVNLFNKAQYPNNQEMVDALKKTGHIPLILSGGVAAAQYELSTRSLGASNLYSYFTLIPSAAEQAKEYLVKQNMMRAIAEYRNKINNKRYELQPNTDAFFFCNRLIIALDNDIIAVNQKSMPKEYEQFDLFTTFHAKIIELVSRFDPDLVGKELINKIEGCLSHLNGHTVELQKKLSDDMYRLLKEYVNDTIKIKLNEAKAELEIDEDQAELLQIIMPLLAYLNSAANPFSRDGLVGAIVTNSFHKEALKAYEMHESKEVEQTGQCNIPFKPAPEIVFDGSQLSQLLFGSPNKNKSKGMLAGLSHSLRTLMSATASSSNTSLVPYSKQRQQTLALQTPKVYLAIEAPKEEPQAGLKK